MPLTAGDHKANFLAKQVLGHTRLIADLQEALKIERWRAMRAEAHAAGAMDTAQILETIARGAVAELPEERREEWLARFPGLEMKEETHGTDPTG